MRGVIRSDGNISKGASKGYVPEKVFLNGYVKCLHEVWMSLWPSPVPHFWVRLRYHQRVTFSFWLFRPFHLSLDYSLCYVSFQVENSFSLNFSEKMTTIFMKWYRLVWCAGIPSSPWSRPIDSSWRNWKSGRGDFKDSRKKRGKKSLLGRGFSLRWTTITRRRTISIKFLKVAGLWMSLLLKWITL